MKITTHYSKENTIYLKSNITNMANKALKHMPTGSLASKLKAKLLLCQMKIQI